MDSKVISPVSVSFLMGMLANGADGTTKEEILATIAGDKNISIDELNDTYAAILRTAANGDKLTTVNIANYIAVNKHFKLKNAYADAVRSRYAANVENLDFASPKTLKRINQWCSDQTDRMIPSIIDRLNSSDIAVLMNAIYFNGTWTDPFSKKYTRQENFQGYTRDIKKVDVMHQNHKFNYADNNLYSAVELPYGNGQYSMTVLLPNEGVSIDDMMNQLTTADNVLRQRRFQPYGRCRAFCFCYAPEGKNRSERGGHQGSCRHSNCHDNVGFASRTATSRKVLCKASICLHDYRKYH